MIEQLLPACVAWAETHDTGDAEGLLYPEEEALVERAVDRRRHEFAAVRGCARRAMATLGLPPAPVLRGHRGMPLWPEGTVGSMTHCDGYRAAVLARATDVRSVGIDAEPDEALPPDIWESVSLPSERWRPAPGANGPSPHWDRLLFSAKESVFKAWFPLTRIELDFLEADISFHRRATAECRGTFTARLLRTAPGMPQVFEGEWLAEKGFVLTAVVLPPV
ncbi:4'-phosphopantetheinyl transferase family protein [Streptomyces nitrosporeus]|uniref:4'-phosphopantetheinyl transferase family protein n=1 Tax=Streptomyces nitrosporeus TaxID=28894 RepID=UPI0039A3F230